MTLVAVRSVGTRLRHTTVIAAGSLLLWSGLMLNAPHAFAAENLSGQIACINSAGPVGVWVQAEKSKSGWASWKKPLEAGGIFKVDYSFTLNNGGRYQVHVGCGGRPEKWANNLKSDYVSGSKNFVCNDVKPWTLAAFKAIAGPIFGRANLTQSIPYNRCNAV